MKNKQRLKIFAIIISIIWILVVSTSLIYNMNNITEKQHHLALEHAKNAFEKDLIFRNWVAMHGGVYVFPTEQTPPNPYLSHIKNRDLKTIEGRDLTLMNPAYTLRELMDNFSGMYGEKGHITSLKLLNPNNKPDIWETKILKEFNNKKFTQTHEIYNYNGSEHLRYMRALKIEPNCLKCHSHQGYKLGDIRGGVSITIPMLKYNNDERMEKKNEGYLHLIILLISFFIGIVIYQMIVASIDKEIKVEDALHHKDQLLAQQSKMAALGEMIDAIAHQWKQPLSTIGMSIQSLEMKVSLGDKVTNEDIIEASDVALSQIDHLTTTIDEFREFFRPNRKQSSVSVNELIRSTLLLMKNELISHSIKYTINGSDDIKVLCIPNEFKHIFINLINNSKDAFIENNTKNSHINFELIQKDNQIIINISDNAGGIPEEIIGDIFISNFTTKDEGQGTGIGLYLVKQIVEKINGTIEVKNIDDGVCFTIII